MNILNTGILVRILTILHKNFYYVAFRLTILQNHASCNLAVRCDYEIDTQKLGVLASCIPMYPMYLATIATIFLNILFYFFALP